MKKLKRFLISTGTLIFAKLPRRIKAAYRILTRKNTTWILLELEEKELMNLMVDKDFETKITYEGTQPYLINKMFQKLNNNIDSIDMILMKAEWEANAEYYAKTGKLLNED